MMRPREPGAAMKAVIGLALAAWCLIPLSYRFFQPFLSTADKDASMYALAAKNFVRYGFIPTRLGMTLNTGDNPPRFSYYDHHPPGVPLAAAVVYAVAGVSDWGARIYPGLCTLGSAGVLFLIWRRHRGAGPALLAVAVVATLPAFGHFGLKLGEEAPTFFWGLLAVLLYGNWKHHEEAIGWRGLVPCLAVYALGCGSGWAAFYVGPLLMIDALVTLNGHRARQRLALAGLAVTGAGCFALVLGHIAWNAGSLDAILAAARSRFVPPAGAAASGPGIGEWLAREGGYFVRLFGTQSAILGTAGVLSGVVAIVRGRWRTDVALTVIVLAGFGVSHVVAFRWAAFYHDWMLFHLMGIVAVAVSEGILLLTSAAAGAVRRISSRDVAVRGVCAIVVAGALGHLAVTGAGGLHLLATESRRYAWPLLSDQINRMAPDDAVLMSNVPISSFPMRFYLDRPILVADSLSTILDRTAGDERALYLRHRNAPIADDVSAWLSTRRRVELAGIDIYALGNPPVDTGAWEGAEDAREAAPAAESRGPESWRGTVDAGYGGLVRMTGYRIDGPLAEPAPLAKTRTFLGMREGTLSHDRIVRVTTDWIARQTDLPAWNISMYMVNRARSGPGSLLPLLALDETAPRFSAWSGREAFRIHAEFMFSEDASPGMYDLNVIVSHGGRTVRPLVPGPPNPDLKVVRIGPIPLPGG